MQGLLETIQKWHIHPVADHFTVAILILAILTDLFATMFSTRLWLRYMALALMVVGTAAAWASNVTGGWEADRVWKAVQAAGGPAYDTLHRHAQLGDWLPWVFLVLAIWRVGIQLFGFMAGMRGLYLLFAILAAIAISYQGYLGGELVYEYGIGTSLCRARDARRRAESGCATERLTDPCVIYEDQRESGSHGQPLIAPTNRETRMERRKVAVVSALFRYPVKSMLGEKPAELTLTTDGTLGDRAWAVREASGRIATAKKWSAMLGFRASYDSPPRMGELAPVTVTFPDGSSIHAADPDASARLSEVIGRPVRLERAQADERSRGEIDPQTIFADVPVEQLLPNFTSQTLPDTFGLMRGAFFDSAPIHVLASTSLEHLKRLCGDDSILDPRRFRPNIFLDTSGTGADGFVEDEWLEGTLEVGETVKIIEMKPALRCVMTTHAQSGLPRDLSILRTAAQHHKATLGVFAAIGAPGTIRVGDPVYLSR